MIDIRDTYYIYNWVCVWMNVSKIDFEVKLFTLEFFTLKASFMQNRYTFFNLMQKLIFFLTLLLKPSFGDKINFTYLTIIKHVCLLKSRFTEVKFNSNTFECHDVKPNIHWTIAFIPQSFPYPNIPITRNSFLNTFSQQKTQNYPSLEDTPTKHSDSTT